MSEDKPKLTRGRPKTLSREHILNVAMMSYWTDDISRVSLNEICRKAQVSKPGVYREFGNDDGLMQETLQLYQETNMQHLLGILSCDVSFKETLIKLIQTVTSMQPDSGAPQGCLFLKMKASYHLLGHLTQEQVDKTDKVIFQAYEKWIEQSKSTNDFPQSIDTSFAAKYIESQLSHGICLLTRGEHPEFIDQMLSFSLDEFLSY